MRLSGMLQEPGKGQLMFITSYWRAALGGPLAAHVDAPPYPVRIWMYCART
jgi:hypothetical protein